MSPFYIDPFGLRVRKYPKFMCSKWFFHIICEQQLKLSLSVIIIVNYPSFGQRLAYSGSTLLFPKYHSILVPHILVSQNHYNFQNKQCISWVQISPNKLSRLNTFLTFVIFFPMIGIVYNHCSVYLDILFAEIETLI